MNRTRGFTLIELLVTITIMVILLTLAVVNLRGTQATGRDDQRKADIEILAQNLENYYKSGSDTDAPGDYPATATLATEASVKQALRDLDPGVLRAPGVANSAAMSLTMAVSTATPTPNTTTYVYQPLQSDGSLCTSAASECRKFNLFYKLETDPAIQKVMSKNQ